MRYSKGSVGTSVTNAYRRGVSLDEKNMPPITPSTVERLLTTDLQDLEIRSYRYNNNNNNNGRVKLRHSQSLTLERHRYVSRKRLLRRMSQSFMPSCVLVPNRNPIEDLYKLFPQLPPGEKPLNDFSCALYKDILLQGKMIICSSCICFHSNIFGYETRVIIHFKNVVAIKRERTAFVVPNAISVRTVKKRYLFCSFLSRETSFKLLSRIWKQAVHMEPDENDNSPTDPIKIRPGGAKEASDDLLNFSSSSSFGSSFPRPTALPDRAFITALFRWIGCFQ
ncbi:uncharacterized protein [Clytia hemisphaerica]|uniref:GRAM domain-containing protein n=1 Tax=Clytia hemisphaerica TaxID=252671 RepID=A0A7M5WQ14_9CNID